MRWGACDGCVQGLRASPQGGQPRLGQSVDSGLKESNCNDGSFSVLGAPKGFGCGDRAAPGNEREREREIAGCLADRMDVWRERERDRDEGNQNIKMQSERNTK